MFYQIVEDWIITYIISIKSFDGWNVDQCILLLLRVTTIHQSSKL